MPPPPPGFTIPLSQEDYDRKNQGGYVTGLPLVNVDPNTGVGYGIRLYYYWNSDRTNPYFGYTPYLHRIFVQAFFTTGGLQYHWIDHDAPAVFGSPYRLRTQLIFLRNTATPFFGTGEASMGALTAPGGQTFTKFKNYDRALRELQPDGTARTRYDQYDGIRPFAVFGIERTLFNGLVRPLLGVGLSHMTIHDYTGKTVDANGPAGSVDAVMAPTRYRERCDAGTLDGCDGGWENFLRLGLSFDTRDYEPDPNHGFFADVALDWATPALFSDYSYVRFLTSARVYWSPLFPWADLVLAARGTFQVQSQDTPFFALNTIAYTEDPKSGLGGVRTMRGFQQDRFVGPALALLNLEWRWTFYRFTLFKQRFGLIAVGFVDTGRVFDRASDFTLRGFRTSWGGAGRISWNMATVVSADYGVSDEGTGLYLNFNHQF
jgi:hypothetical protein